jgi:hypothetical protein
MFTNSIVKQNLYKLKVDIEDTEYTSKYFEVVGLQEQYTKGQHFFGLRGSLYLKPGSEIDGEMLDQREQIVPLYLTNYEYNQQTGVASLGFDVTNASVQGDVHLVLVGTTRDNKIVRWQKKITVIKEYTIIQEKYGGFVDLPKSRPVEVYNLTAVCESSSNTSSTYNLRLYWGNHNGYTAPFYTTQSQGGTSQYNYTDPTQSILNQSQLNNITKYHVFVFAPYTKSTGWHIPAGWPNYYPYRSDNPGNQSGSWYWVDSIPAPQGYPTVKLTDDGAGLAKLNIDYVIKGLPAGRPYYAYVAMTTDYSMQRWESNFWQLLPKGIPEE